METPPPARNALMRLSSAVVLVAVAVLLGAALIPSHFAAPSAANIPPSRLLVLVTIDALRADHLGIYGYARPTSPFIDAFAREALVIEDAIAQAPYTKASIASLMTGLYPTAHKTYTTAASVADTMDGAVDGARGQTDVLPGGVTTLAEALKAIGYATAAITTNPFLIRDFGFAQGFDTFEFVADGGFAPADTVLARALRIIGARAGPLFLWVHLMEPHSPYEPGDTYARALPQLLPERPIPLSTVVPDYLAVTHSRDARYYETLYDREIRTVDAAFGYFLTALRQAPAWPNIPSWCSPPITASSSSSTARSSTTPGCTTS
jgi:hypothetical protein